MAECVCRAVGCTTSRKRSQFMCLPHWRALPKLLRDQINATWRAWQSRTVGQGERLMLDYTEACDEARRWMAERDGQLAAFTPELPRLTALYKLRSERL